MKITHCEIGPMPKKFVDPLPKVVAVFEDGTSKVLFTFFPDEISFTPEEIVGKTEDEVYQLRHNKDVAYLRS